MSNRKFYYRHFNCVRRHFAGEVVALHPYHRPPNLFEATEELIQYLKLNMRHEIDVLRGTEKRWRLWIRLFCRGNRLCRKWNVPRKNKKVKILFTSRYETPKPEYDFIDLDALANNVVREILKDE